MPPESPVGDQFAEVLEFCRQYLLATANADLPDALRAKGGASDLVQDTLAAAHQFRHQFAGQTVGELRAWLRGILTNELATFCRRFAGTAARDVTREVPLAEAAAQTADPSPLADLIREDENRRLSARLDRLPEPFRQVVLLRVEEGLPFAAIGERIGRTEEAARKLFARALDRLRRAPGPTTE